MPSYLEDTRSVSQYSHIKSDVAKSHHIIQRTNSGLTQDSHLTLVSGKAAMGLEDDYFNEQPSLKRKNTANAKQGFERQDTMKQIVVQE